MAEQKKEGGVSVSEGEGKGLSVSLIVIVILLIIGAFYLMSGKKAVAPEMEVVLETPTSTAPVMVENPLVAERVSKVLASGLGIAPELVSVVSITEKEWSDGCLGLGKADEMCSQALVPGYEAKLSAQGVTYTYRTDKAVNVIKIDVSSMGK